MSARPLFVGTYSESLGHVDGKGEGVYAFLFDRENMRLDPFVPAAKLTTPQLGGSTGLINPTWLAEYENGTFLYICDEQHGDRHFCRVNHDGQCHCKCWHTADKGDFYHPLYANTDHERLSSTATP